jgi:hypothetical protein
MKYKNRCIIEILVSDLISINDEYLNTKNQVKLMGIWVLTI